MTINNPTPPTTPATPFYFGEARSSHDPRDLGGEAWESRLRCWKAALKFRASCNDSPVIAVPTPQYPPSKKGGEVLHLPPF